MILQIVQTSYEIRLNSARARTILVITGYKLLHGPTTVGKQHIMTLGVRKYEYMKFSLAKGRLGINRSNSAHTKVELQLPKK